MPRAVVILPSTTYRAGDFVSAAESLGIDLVVASEQPPPFDMGDRYLQIDCADPDTAADAVAQLGDDVPLDGVVAADDGGVVIAAITGSILGLPANPREAALSTRDKLMMRAKLDSSEVPQPRYRSLERIDDLPRAAAALGFPLVVKPIDRSASQGVIRVDSFSGLKEAVAGVREIVGNLSATLLAEEYLSGSEIAVEGLVSDGQLNVLALFDKPDKSSGPYFPETILVTPSRLPDDVQDECVRVADLAVHGLGLTHGPVHIELMVSEGSVRVIEVAARSIGGLCSRSLSFGLMDTTLETLILRNALALDKPELRHGPHASGVLMIPIERDGVLDRVRGIEEARSIEGVTGIDMTIHPGARVYGPPTGDRYLGFVFARGTDPATVEAALRKAAVIIEPAIT